MPEQKQSVEIDWRGVAIEIRLTTNWLNGTAHHLEIQAAQPLPVTQTGYRSHFFGVDQDIDIDQARSFVLRWLDEKAQSNAWHDAEERRRQGDLFDL